MQWVREIGFILLIDMSAAFDTVSHNILLDRLEEIGITDKALIRLIIYYK